jgi:glycosyltransferase involved in cell wall biosynthesis
VAGEAAILIDPYDVAAMAAAIEGLLKNPELRAGLRERGRLRAAEFSWRRTCEMTLDLYRRARA